VKRVNIALKDDVHTKAKLIAVLKETTLNDYFEKAIEDALEKDRTILEKLKKQL
jgi:predicted HicB family RNase H-like nuclease